MVHRVCTAPPTGQGMTTTVTATTTVAAQTVETIGACVVFGPKPEIASLNEPCDRCPAAVARGRALFETGPLYLCGHHLRTCWDDLMSSALELTVDIPGRSFYLPATPQEQAT